MGTKMCSEETVTCESGWDDCTAPFKLFCAYDSLKTQFWGVRPRWKE